MGCEGEEPHLGDPIPALAPIEQHPHQDSLRRGYYGWRSLDGHRVFRRERCSERARERYNFARVVAVTLERSSDDEQAIDFRRGCSRTRGISNTCFRGGQGQLNFLVKTEGNFAEVQMGELAQKNGQSPAVKSFGEMLQSDHSAANEKALDAAKELGVKAPEAPN
jgi:hypothetical protein